MQSFAPGSPAPITFSYVNDAGEALTPTGLRSRVTDEADVVLQNWTTVTLPGSGTTVTVTVIGALNILTPPAVRGIRVVELEITTAAGVFLVSQSFRIAATSTLVFGVNSFQTYNQALLLAEDISTINSPGWAGATRVDREAAMAEAYTRIQLLPVAILWDDSQSVLEVDTEFLGNYGPLTLRNLTAAQMATLYVPLLIGLRQAQLAEADEILQGNTVSQRAGRILSEKVGESSTSFSTASSALDLGISQRAVKFIARWVRFGAKIQRS